MTVKELREALANYPDDMELHYVSYDQCSDPQDNWVDSLKAVSLDDYQKMVLDPNVANAGYKLNQILRIE